MPINIAARRGAKNQRRKAVVAQQRKAEAQLSGIAGLVRHAQNAPIQQCLISEGLFEVGMGTLVLIRGATPRHVTMATFLLDTYAMGVKDVFVRSLDAHELAFHLEYLSRATPMVAIDPGHARKLLRDLVAWSRTLGIAPHRDHAKVEPIFGSVSTATCDAEFAFGHEGKPLLIADLSDMEMDFTESDADAAD